MNTLIDDGLILWGLNRHGCLSDFGTVFFRFDWGCLTLLGTNMRLGVGPRFAGLWVQGMATIGRKEKVCYAKRFAEKRTLSAASLRLP